MIIGFGGCVMAPKAMSNVSQPVKPAIRSRTMRMRRASPGAAPGTLVADPNAQLPAISVFRYGANALEEFTVDDPSMIPEPDAAHEVTWINIDGLGDIETLRTIGQRFNFHDLALEDVINVHQRPKAEDHDGYLFVVARLPLSSSVRQIDTEQISFFLKEGLLITFQEQTGDCFDPVRQRLRDRRGRIRRDGADYLLYALLDAMTDSYFPVMERYGDQVEELNEMVMTHIEAVTPTEFHRVRQDLMTLRRAIFPLREMFAALLRDPPRYITETTQFYLRDCYDHAIQLLDFVETYREIASSSIELYMAGINNRMNEIIKVFDDHRYYFYPVELYRESLRHELRYDRLALEHAGAEMVFWLSFCAWTDDGSGICPTRIFLASGMVGKKFVPARR